MALIIVVIIIVIVIIDILDIIAQHIAQHTAQHIAQHIAQQIPACLLPPPAGGPAGALTNLNVCSKMYSHLLNCLQFY